MKIEPVKQYDKPKRKSFLMKNGRSLPAGLVCMAMAGVLAGCGDAAGSGSIVTDSQTPTATPAASEYILGELTSAPTEYYDGGLTSEPAPREYLDGEDTAPPTLSPSMEVLDGDVALPLDTTQPSNSLETLVGVMAYPDFE